MLAMLWRTIRLMPDASDRGLESGTRLLAGPGPPYATEVFDDGPTPLAWLLAADLELAVLGRTLSSKSVEPVRVTGPVVEGDRVTDALAGHQLPQLH